MKIKIEFEGEKAKNKTKKLTISFNGIDVFVDYKNMSEKDIQEASILIGTLAVSFSKHFQNALQETKKFPKGLILRGRA